MGLFAKKAATPAQGKPKPAAQPGKAAAQKEPPGKGASTARPKAAAATKRRPRRRTRGALATIGGLLIASALLRVATGAGEAIAANTPQQAAEPTAPQASDQMAAQSASPSDGALIPGGMASAEDIAPLLEALSAREARVKQREAAIARRMQALAVAEEEIDRKLSALQEAESELRQTLALASTAAEDDLSRLTTVYASMKPREAAALFEEMAPEFAAGFLGRMRPDAAAQIMAGLSPRAAYTISVILAGRNANAPNP